MSDGVFTSIKEQIARLKNECNITIEDEKRASRILKRVGYSWLLDKYGIYNKIEGERRKFIDGTTIEAIYAVYDFDLSLKKMIFPYIQKIEQKIKALLGYYFAKQYSYKHTEYLNKGKYFPLSADKAINLIEKKLAEITNDKEEQDNIPFWDIVNEFTCGDLCNFFSCLKNDLINQICAEFLTVGGDTMKVMLYIMSRYRNCSAHDNPLFCSKIESEAEDPILKRKKRELHNFYDCLVVIAYLSEKEDIENFLSEFGKLIKELKSNVLDQVYIKIFKDMGLSKNWKNIFIKEKDPLPFFDNIKIDNEEGSVRAVKKKERPVIDSKEKRQKEKEIKRRKSR